MLNRLIITKVFSILIFTLSTTVSYSDIRWQKGVDYIETTKIANGNFDHPHKANPEKVARILSNVVIKEGAKNTFFSISKPQANTRKVFSAAEIETLANAICNALSTMQPDEIITFTVSDQRSAYLGGKNLSTSGSTFIKNNQLNLLFGEVHVDFQRQYLRSGASVSNSRFASNAELGKFRLNTGDLTEETEHNWALSLFSGASAANSRSDWISVDLKGQYDFDETLTPEEQANEKYYSENQKKKLTQPNKLEARIRKLEEAQSSVDQRSFII
ncbi:hypothetical protein [Neptuniibacter sp.]|uniref:hypothetical protein n=1 Tax=Neptuniibacter sp. TaxID=1962643 RepID=UPI003B5C40EE